MTANFWTQDGDVGDSGSANVGIGISSPNELLEVNGNIMLTDPESNRVWTTQKVFNVLDYGAQGDGTANDKNAFEAALTAASDSGGGIVYAPSGKYKIDHESSAPFNGRLVIPENVTLMGNWCAPSSLSTLTVGSLEGTWLLAYQNKSEATIASGTSSTITISTSPDLYKLAETGAFTDVIVGDELVVLSGTDAGSYSINFVDPSGDFVYVEVFASADTNVEWEVIQPFINLSGLNSGIKNLIIYYPEQAIGGSVAVPTYTEFPWSVTCAGDNTNVINVNLINPYKGVRVCVGRSLLSGLFGQPLNIGIELLFSLDVTRIENIHFWPFWSQYAYGEWFGDTTDMKRVRNFQLIHGTGILIKNADQSMLSNIFIFAYNKGLSFDYGNHTDQIGNVFVSNMQTDLCIIGIYVNYVDEIGILLSNFDYFAHPEEYKSTDLEIPSAVLDSRKGIEGTDQNDYNLTLTGGNIRGEFLEGIHWEAGESLLLTNITFRKALAALDQIGIKLSGGQAIITGCYFPDSFTSMSSAIVAASTDVQLLGTELNGSQISGVEPNQIMAASGNVNDGASSACLAITSTSNTVGGLAELKFGGTPGAIGAAVGYRHQDGSNNSNGDVVISTRPVSTDTNLTEALRIKFGGDVGIGTTSPQAKLEVNGEIRTTDSDSDRYLVFTNVDSNNYGLHFDDSEKSLTIWTNTNPRLTVLNDGNVGIGTTNPQSDLHVVDETVSRIIVESTGEDSFPGISFKNDEQTWLIQNQGGDNNKLIIYDETNTAVRMTIDTGGNVGIGTTSPGEKLDVNGNARFRSIGSGSSAGALHYTSTGVLTTNTSDRRKKKNIKALENPLDKISKLRGVRFEWKDKAEKGKKIGLIAQEVEKIYPELVFTNPNDGYKGVHYSELTSVLLEAVKAQQKQISQLEKKVSKLLSKGKK